MKTPVLKEIIVGTADIVSVCAGKVEYKLTDAQGDCWQLIIDTTDTCDCGETATFKAHEKSLLLMRWIRRAIESNILYPVKG